MTRKAFVLSISRGILFVLLSLFVCTTLFKKNGIWISCTVSEIFCLGIALYDLKTQKKYKKRQIFKIKLNICLF